MMRPFAGLDEGQEEEGEEGAGAGEEPEPAPSFPKMDLSVPEGAVDRAALAMRIVGEIDNYRLVTERKRDQSTAFRMAYEMMPPGTANRWDNSSDVPSSFTRLYPDSHRVRLNQQIGGESPPYAVISNDQQGAQYSDRVGEALWSVLEAARWQETMYAMNGELALMGNCFVRTTYERVMERHPRVKVDYDPRRTARHMRAGGESGDALWAGVKGVKLEHETVVAYDGVCFKVIPWEDGLILPPTIRNPNDAYGIGEVYMVRGADLVLGAKRGIYDEDAVRQLLERQSDQMPEWRRERLDAQGLVESYSGVRPGYGKTPGLYSEYEVAELCWKMDIDDDGLMEWVVVVLHLQTRTILRLQMLEYEHGQPYYTMLRYIVRPAELFGMGIAELIATYHDADTAVINQIIDHGDLALNWNGNIFYDNTSGYAPDRFVLQLGRGIRVENLGGIKPIPQMALPAEHYQLHQHFREICDLLTATSNMTLGKPAETSKTLGEMQMAASSLHQAFEDHAAQVAMQYAYLWDQVRWLVSQYGVGSDGEVKYRRSAAPDDVQFRTIPPDVLRSKVELVPTGLKQMADMGTRVQLATMVRNSLMGDPLVATNVPAKLILDEEYLKALRYGQRDRLMAEIKKGVAAHQALQKLEVQGGGGAPLLGGAGPLAPGGARPAAGAPALPGPMTPKPPAGSPAPPPPNPPAGPGA